MASTKTDQPEMGLDTPDEAPATEAMQAAMDAEKGQPQPKQYRRAGEFSNGIGSTLEAIEDQDVLLIGYGVSSRRIFDQRQDASVDRTYVSLTIARNPAQPDVVESFHSWSPALGERLNEIPQTKLPVIAKFSRVDTANGFKAWVVS